VAARLALAWQTGATSGDSGSQVVSSAGQWINFQMGL